LRDLLSGKRSVIKIYERKYTPQTIEALQEQKKLLGVAKKERHENENPFEADTKRTLPNFSRGEDPLSKAGWMDANLDVAKGGSIKRARSLPIESWNLLRPKVHSNRHFPTN